MINEGKDKKKSEIPLHVPKKYLSLHPLNSKTRIESLAQQVEHNTFNVGVLGSSPKRFTENNLKQMTPIISRYCGSFLFQLRCLNINSM
jgi:hypothetical protein